MAILVNIEPAHECYEAMQEGMKAAKQGKPETANPHVKNSRDYALWIMGYWSQIYEWDVEW
jgi:hypothetical protein